MLNSHEYHSFPLPWKIIVASWKDLIFMYGKEAYHLCDLDDQYCPFQSPEVDSPVHMNDQLFLEK